ncbi:MAG TPA: hypothetical protein VJN90_00450 [Candidatus Acidoferrales bacterium]|nr:hypothetical protein [Candidatus Acidoferrales bacterium]
MQLATQQDGAQFRLYGCPVVPSKFCEEILFTLTQVGTALCELSSVGKMSSGPRFRLCACPILSARCGQWREVWELRVADKAALDRSCRVISNRYTKLLELPVTYTKQTVARHSNRYKNALSRNHFLALKCATSSGTIAPAKDISIGQEQPAAATFEEVTLQ